MANTTTRAKGRKRIKRGLGKRMVDGKSFLLADEVRYIQRRAAEHDERIVTVGQLVLFSTETGDAWLLDALSRAGLRLSPAIIASPSSGPKGHPQGGLCPPLATPHRATKCL